MRTNSKKEWLNYPSRFLITFVFMLGTFYLSLHIVLDFLGFSSSSFFVSILATEIPAAVFVIVGLNGRFIHQVILLRKVPLIRGLALLSYGFYSIWCLLLSLQIYQIFYSITRFVLLIAGSIIVGLSEEIIFRGILLGKLLAFRLSVWKSIGLSSFVFGLFHAFNVFHQSLYLTFIQMAANIFLGILLAEVYIVGKNIGLPILLHAMVDFASFSYLFGFGVPEPSWSSVFLVGLAAGLTTFVLQLWNFFSETHHQTLIEDLKS